MTDNEITLETVLEKLDYWRHFPKYRLELHVDVLFGLTLPTVLSKRFNVCKDELCVIPEFPIKNRWTYQSWNVDFAVLAKDTECAFLVELKTDDSSIDHAQLKRMSRVGSVAQAVANIPKIANKSRQKGKYDHLMCELVRADAMSYHPEATKRQERYSSNGRFSSKPEIVLICPTEQDHDGIECIDFEQYATKISPTFGEMFACYLRRWICPPGQ